MADEAREPARGIVDAVSRADSRRVHALTRSELEASKALQRREVFVANDMRVSGPPCDNRAAGMMNRDRALKVVLVLVGVLFSAVILPMVIMVRIVLQPHSENALPTVIRMANEAMIFSLYATLGIFLLMAARNPSAHRSVIAFTAWSSFAHAAVMAVMSIGVPTARAEWLITSVALGIIGALLIVLAPGKQTPARAAAA